MNTRIGERKKFVLKNFEKIDLDTVKIQNEFFVNKIFNFNSSNGIVKSGKGFENISIPVSKEINAPEVVLNVPSLNLSDIEGVMHFTCWIEQNKNTISYLFVYGEDKKVYYNWMYFGFDDFINLFDLEFQKCPNALYFRKDGIKAVLFTSEADNMIVWRANYTPIELTGVPKITSMCELDSILFCTVGGEANCVWYTSSLDPQAIGTSASGMVALDGELGACRKVVSFKGYIFVFRDYGISKITYFNENSIKVDNLYCSPSIIYTNTVAACGTQILFLSRDGLYTFNGITVDRLNAGIDSMIYDNKNKYAVGACLQNCYYLAVKVDFNDGLQIMCETEENYKNNVLIIYNTEFKTFEIVRGVDIRRMLALKDNNMEKLIATFNSVHNDKIGQLCEGGKLFGENMPKQLCTNKIEITQKAFASIRKLIVWASAGVAITIAADDGNITLTTEKEGRNMFDLFLKSKYVQIIVNANDEARLQKIEMEVVDLAEKA